MIFLLLTICAGVGLLFVMVSLDARDRKCTDPTPIEDDLPESWLERYPKVQRERPEWPDA